MEKVTKQEQNREARKLPSNSRVQKDLKVVKVKNPVIKLLLKWLAKVGIRVKVNLLKVLGIQCRNKMGNSRVIAKAIKEVRRAALI
jgi:hypothetical protein